MIENICFVLALLAIFVISLFVKNPIAMLLIGIVIGYIAA